MCCVQVEMEHKTLDFVCCNPGYDFVDYYDWLHESLTGWMRPYLSLFIDPHWMAASIPWIWIIIFSVMDGCAHTTYISCIWDISCTSSRRFSDGGVFSWTCSRKAFHPSLTFGPRTLGGICYTVICHHPCNPRLAHCRFISVTNKQCHALQIPSLHSFPWGQHSFCWLFPEQTPKNTCFCLGTGSPLCPRANEEN